MRTGCEEAETSTGEILWGFFVVKESTRDGVVAGRACGEGQSSRVNELEA